MVVTHGGLVLLLLLESLALTEALVRTRVLRTDVPALKQHAISMAEGELPQVSALQRGLAATAAGPWIAHNAPLPAMTRRLISSRARLVLAFVLDYLDDQKLDAELHASGGYVRDLLLGRISNDLDLSLCLIRCP